MKHDIKFLRGADRCIVCGLVPGTENSGEECPGANLDPAKTRVKISFEETVEVTVRKFIYIDVKQEDGDILSPEGAARDYLGMALRIGIPIPWQVEQTAPPDPEAMVPPHRHESWRFKTEIVYRAQPEFAEVEPAPAPIPPPPPHRDDDPVHREPYVDRFEIVEDGPDRYVVIDHENDDGVAPVYPSRGQAETARDEFKRDAGLPI